MIQSKTWGNVYVDGDVYTSGYFGLHILPTDQAQRNRDRYNAMVESILAKFAQYQSAHALMTSILKLYPKTVILRPYVPVAVQSDPKGDACNSVTTPRDVKDAFPPNIDTKLCKPEGADKNDLGTGRGTKATVYFSPWLWVDYKSTCVPTQRGIAGANSDEVLLHELVHALEIMSGTLDTCTRFPGHDDKFFRSSTVAEFNAVLVTNVYSSETARPLSQDHSGFEELKPPLIATKNWYYDHFAAAIDRFAAAHPDLAAQLRSFATIRFNPFLHPGQ